MVTHFQGTTRNTLNTAGGNVATGHRELVNTHPVN